MITSSFLFNPSVAAGMIGNACIKVALFLFLCLVVREFLKVMMRKVHPNDFWSARGTSHGQPYLGNARVVHAKRRPLSTLNKPKDGEPASSSPFEHHH